MSTPQKKVVANQAVFDRLYNSPTTASTNQRYDVSKAREQERVKPAGTAKPKKHSPMKSAALPRVAKLASPTSTANGHAAAPSDAKRTPSKKATPKRKTKKAAASSGSNGHSTTEAVPDAVMKIQIPPKSEGMKLFSRLDPNGNGLLSLAELDKGVLELFPKFNNKPAIMRAYKAADKSGDGFVTRGEFGYFLRFLQYFNNLWSLFVAIDTSGDRRITEQEFHDAALLLDLGKDPNEVFAEIDENGGGFILFDELCHWMAVNKSTWGDDEHVDAHDLEEAKKKEEEASKPAPPPPAPVPAEAMKLEIPSKEEVLKLFDAWDPNGNGVLSLAELDKGILEMQPQFNNKPAIMRAYKASDRNGDGLVKRSEFYFFLKFIQYYHHLWEVFETIDTSDDRRITLEEFTGAYDDLGLSGDPETDFAEIDTNHGGFILFEEFCTWKAKSDTTAE